MKASCRIVEAELNPVAELSSFSRQRGHSGKAITVSSLAISGGTGLMGFDVKMTSLT